MNKINNDTPLVHICSNGTRFAADRADLRTGVRYFAPAYLDAADIAQDHFEFGAWHAYAIHPDLNGFSGYDGVKFEQSAS